ncbi:MAG: type II CRISPR-associated endonuclease Cas1 [Clostridia bacterium]|nr:type II CRISPR-associated endonuclease Cas1 [Clostridia bacterium]
MVVETAAECKTADGCLLIAGGASGTVPLCEIRDLIVSSPAASFTAGALGALAESGVNVLICDKKHIPVSQVVPITRHTRCAGNIIIQAGWEQKTRAAVWRDIVISKILSQSRLLAELGLSDPETLVRYASRVLPGDTGCMESVAARVYFRSLFGHGYIRHTESELNHALNYGYALIRSAFTRIITLHGYAPALGIAHCSEFNPFNLACDLMEPFRPLADRIAYEYGETPFDREKRAALLGILNSKVVYNGLEYEFYDAAERFALDVFALLKGENRTVGEISVCPKNEA